MDALGFIASLVSSLAWPVLVAVVVVLFRDQIRRTLDRLPKRFKAGPLEVEWPEVATDARVALATSPEVEGASRTGSLTKRLAALAQEEPGAAIMVAWSEIERALHDKAGDLDGRQRATGGMTLARAAFERGTISEAALGAVSGLVHLRNLAAHGRADDIDEEKALDYLTLADATLYAVQNWPSNPS